MFLLKSSKLLSGNEKCWIALRKVPNLLRNMVKMFSSHKTGEEVFSAKFRIIVNDVSESFC